MKILLSWSSGKDSAWALHVLNVKRRGAVAALLTTVNESADRVATHGVGREVLEAQASAAGLPLRVVPLPDQCPDHVYEARMREAFRAAAADAFTHVAFGDLFLKDIRRYREKLVADTGLKALFPVWGIPTDRLAHDMICAGLKARVSCVDTRILGPSFAGREFNATMLADLPSGVDPCGENGEFHTCVCDGPMFSGPVRLEVGRPEKHEPFAWADLRLAGRPTVVRTGVCTTARPASAGSDSGTHAWTSNAVRR